ncbi:hypothetical protein ACQKNS_06320 [Peribacillus sp. NPDC094092]|uniref:hypothetical protein n=1 Tax=Peribacillus sp. NPDC094092 TaxID=3390611 RepID=UPI003D053CA9
MTHVQKAALHVRKTIIGELPAAEALNVALAGGGPLATRKDALAAGGPLATRKDALPGGGPLSVRKGALAGGGPLAADKGALAGEDPLAADKGAPTTADGFAAISFTIDGKGASSFMVPLKCTTNFFYWILNFTLKSNFYKKTQTRPEGASFVFFKLSRSLYPFKCSVP